MLGKDFRGPREGRAVRPTPRNTVGGLGAAPPSLAMGLIPSRVSAKSYRTGSSGHSMANFRVTSTAVFRSACLRAVRPILPAIRKRWVSRGTISRAGDTVVQGPGSTASLRTIHRRKRLRRLQALPSPGEERRLAHAFGPPASCRRRSTNAASAGRIVSSFGPIPATNRRSRLPCAFIANLIPTSRDEISLPVVNRCLKLRNRSNSSCGSASSMDLRRDERFPDCRPLSTVPTLSRI